jgi:Rod binding domain-containing protein
MNADHASMSVAIDRQVADCAELLDPKELAKIKDTAQQFESLLLYSLLKQMWATLPENSMLEQGMAAQFYREMWLEELAGQISTDGPGLGIAKTVEREMITHAARTITPAALAAE